MGGQACVLYGAAEFSRDTDLVIVADAANLRLLQSALNELQAQRIAVPELSAKNLLRGFAVHFRCKHADAFAQRIDIMATLRGVDSFDRLWARRTTLIHPQIGELNLLSLPDLVQAKKTQRDKDWPMIRRLVEANYAQFRDSATENQIQFWFLELRTPELLVELCRNYPRFCRSLAKERPLLSVISEGEIQTLAKALADEEAVEREQDRAHWLPLKRELQSLRRNR